MEHVKEHVTVVAMDVTDHVMVVMTLVIAIVLMIALMVVMVNVEAAENVQKPVLAPAMKIVINHAKMNVGDVKVPVGMDVKMNAMNMVVK